MSDLWRFYNFHCFSSGVVRCSRRDVVFGAAPPGHHACHAEASQRLRFHFHLIYECWCTLEWYLLVVNPRMPSFMHPTVCPHSLPLLEGVECIPEEDPCAPRYGDPRLWYGFAQGQHALLGCRSRSLWVFQHVPCQHWACEVLLDSASESDQTKCPVQVELGTLESCIHLLPPSALPSSASSTSHRCIHTSRAHSSKQHGWVGHDAHVNLLCVGNVGLWVPQYLRGHFQGGGLGASVVGELATVYSPLPERSIDRFFLQYGQSMPVISNCHLFLSNPTEIQQRFSFNFVSVPFTSIFIWFSLVLAGPGLGCEECLKLLAVGDLVGHFGPPCRALPFLKQVPSRAKRERLGWTASWHELTSQQRGVADCSQARLAWWNMLWNMPTPEFSSGNLGQLVSPEHSMLWLLWQCLDLRLMSWHAATALLAEANSWSWGVGRRGGNCLLNPPRI